MKISFIFFFLIAGIVTGNFSAGYSHIVFFAAFALSVLPCFFFYFRKKQGILIICVLFFIFGYLSIQERVKPDLPSHHISNFLDTKGNVITGKIVSFAKHYKRKYQVTLLCQTIKPRNNTESFKGLKKVTGKIKLSIYGSSNKKIGYGDIIRFKSSLKSIRNFQNPGGFDYKRFLKLQGVYGSAWTSTNKIEILTHRHAGADSGDEVQSTLFSQMIRKIENLRIHYFHFILNQIDYSNSGKIMASLITGKKEIIPHAIRDLFSKAGISHLLAISGLHLSIVSLLFFSILYRFFSLFSTLLISGNSKKIAGIISIVPLILYGIFTGFSPSCQRALIMIIVLIFAFIREKEKDVISSLSLAGILILILDSAALFSISFQLSFSAVIFIVYGASLLKQYLPLILKKNIWSKAGVMVFITLFAGLGTSPLTAHYFNIVSIIAPISNFIAIPLLGFIVLPLGLVCLLCFLWLPAFAGFLIYVCTQLISYLIIFSQFIISLPFAWSRTVTLQWCEIAALYLIFISIFLIFKGYKKAFAVILFLSFLLIISNFVSLGLNKSDEDLLQITTIDVGQGNSTLIQTPEGENILVDGGGFSDISSFDTGRYIIAPFLWKKRIKIIDYVILTHPEADHLNGLIFILDNFGVKTLIKNSDVRDTHAYNTMVRICKKRNIKIFNPLDHDKIFGLGRIRLKFFDSSKDLLAYNYNNNSLVFKLIYKKFSMLFPGDILKSREKKLCLKPDIGLHSDIMLAPHHGSNSSSTKIFLEKVVPASVIISCGFQNKYNFPDHRVLKRYQARKIKIFRTDENGAVFISSDGNDYKIKTFIIK